VVAKRKTHKNEVELPAAGRENPYAMLSREELDAKLAEIDAKLAQMPDESPQRETLKRERNLVSQGYGWLLVRQGFMSWEGGKPKGLDPLIEVTPGPPISDYIIEDRR
jgi:hypothetical protein